MFRSPVAVFVWWIWLLFAVGNLIDLAVQGHDHVSLIAAGTLLVATGVVYVAAFRPRVIAADDGLTVVNPLRDHQVDWAAVTAVDTTDLLRIRCQWPAGDGAEPAKRAIYAWAVHSSRRRQVASEVRAQRLARRGSGRGGIFGTAQPDNAPAPAPLGVDAESVASILMAHAEEARTLSPEVPAGPPTVVWSWPSVAALAVPVIILLITIWVLRRPVAVALSAGLTGGRVATRRSRPGRLP